MPREPRCRRVSHEPKVNLYKPQGVPCQCLQEVVLKVEELEAIRLKDVLRLEQEECAQKMMVSRPTFQRILNEAHYKVAYALTNGQAIRIEGGNYCLGRGFCRRHGRYMSETDACYQKEDEITYDDAKGGGDMTKIAVCSTGDSPDSQVDERFGRCTCFMIFDRETGQFESVPNTGGDAAHGAGTGATQELINRQVGVVIAQRVGPKAFSVLQQSGIKIFSGAAGKTVEAALRSYEAGELTELTSPNN